MRVIVPLQAVFQGPGGLVLGTILPCALFYALQLLRGKWRATNSNLQQQQQQNPNPRAPSLSDAESNAKTETLEMSGSDDAFISSRALALTKSPYYLTWDEFTRNPYHPVDNPGGCIQLGLAENKLCWDLIVNWIKNHPQEWPDDGLLSFHQTAGYDSTHGILPVREVLASFMSEVMGGRLVFDAEHLVLAAGASAALEILAFTLAEPGDGFLIPSPYYPGFDRDIRWRAGVELLPIPCHSKNDFKVTKAALEKSFYEAKTSGTKVRAILICSPSNPLGTTFDRASLLMILNFAHEKNLHIISDEVYAGSVADKSFLSIAEIMDPQNYDVNKIHIVYSLSKDLGLSGYRVGIIHSWNTKVLSLAKGMTRFCAVSTHTQCLISAMLADKKFVRDVITENHSRLEARRKRVASLLEEVGIRSITCNAGLFFWIDMRPHLASQNLEEELHLLKKLLYEGGLALTAGTSCHCVEPGWFRLCYADSSDHILTLAFQRLKSLLP